MAKAPSILKLERELKAVERQAIKDGDSLLKLQEKLEMLQTFKGVGNPLTVADTDAKIKETTAEIEKLSAVIDNANLKTLQLKASIREAASNTAGKFQKTAQKLKKLPQLLITFQEPPKMWRKILTLPQKVPKN